MKPLPKFVKARNRIQHLTYFRHELAHTESLLGRWSRFCLKQCMSIPEVVTMLAPFDAKASVLRQEVGIPHMVGPRAMSNWAGGQRRVAEVLGMSSVDVACATGGILGSKSLCAESFVPQLRWCPACFSNGFHSIVFQHRALARCPFHGRELIDACPKCCFAHKPTYFSVARLPFGCPRCEEAWLPPGKRPGLPMHAAVIGAMLNDRAHELGITERPQRTFVARSSCKIPDRLTLSACRSSARGLAWPVGISSHWPRFKTSTAFLNDWEVETRLGIRGTDQVAAVRDCLSWLEHSCDCAEESRQIRESVTPILGKVSVAAIALHLTIAKYTKQRLQEDSPVPTAPSVQRIYGGVVWTGFQASNPIVESPTGNALIVRAEILAYFSLALLRAASFPSFPPYGWSVNADPNTCAATNWVVEPGSAGHLLHFRPRATAQSVMRLLQRYRHRKVEAWPDPTPVGGTRGWRSYDDMRLMATCSDAAIQSGTHAEVTG